MRYLFFLAALAWIAPASAGKLTITLKGKTVSSIPVDKLPELQFRVDAGMPYKTFYKKQWGSLEHGLLLSATGSAKAGAPPNTDGLADWPRMHLEQTRDDKSWGNHKSSEPTSAAVLRGCQLYRHDTTEVVTFTVTYQRLVYTGKLVVEGKKLVKETRWEIVGPILAQTTLALEPPTFASTFDGPGVIATAAEKANTEKNRQYDETYAEAFARHIMGMSGGSDRKTSYVGSTVKDFKSAGPPAFSWNFVDGGADYIAARAPFILALHAKNTTTFNGVPKPEVIEGDFTCKEGVYVSAVRPLLGTEKFVYKETVIGQMEGCKTADGKTGKDLAATAKGPIDPAVIRAITGDKSKTQEQQALELMKHMGMDTSAAEAEQKAKQQ